MSPATSLWSKPRVFAALNSLPLKGSREREVKCFFSKKHYVRWVAFRLQSVRLARGGFASYLSCACPPTTNPRNLDNKAPPLKAPAL